MKKILLLITLLSAILWTGTASNAQPVTLEQSPWGISAHPGRNMRNLEQIMAMTANAGIGWLREDFSIPREYANPGANVGFTRFDTILAEAELNNVQILPILHYSPSLLFSKDKDGVYVPSEQGIKIWTRFVRDVAKRYDKRMKVWEIWNEEDGSIKAATYVTFLKIAYREIKAVNPQATVMVGGLISWNGDFIKEMYAQDAKGYFNAIAVHPYGLEPDVTDYQRIKMDNFKQVLAENGQSDIPVWITESGATTPATDLQLKYPQFILSAIRYAQEKLNHPKEKTLRIGVLLSSGQLPASWSWLRGANIQLINSERLKNLDPKDCPTVLITSESIYDYQIEPLRSYIERGGLVTTVQKLPFYFVYRKDAQGYWVQKQDPGYTYPLFRIGYEAWWTNKELPKSTFDVRLASGLENSDISPVQNVYADRFFTNKNMHPGDKFTPILDAYDKSGESLAHAAALYTYGDWKGGILTCASPLRSTTEAEQANLIQRSTLSYLAEGVKKVFIYDLHNDGIDPLEREHNFGILHNDYTPKMSYYAYSTMMRQLGGAPSFVKKLETDDPDFTALVFHRSEDDKLVLAFWSTDQTKSFNIVNKETNSILTKARGSIVRYLTLQGTSADQISITPNLQ